MDKTFYLIKDIEDIEDFFDREDVDGNIPIKSIKVNNVSVSTKIQQSISFLKADNTKISIYNLTDTEKINELTVFEFEIEIEPVKNVEGVDRPDPMAGRADVSNKNKVVIQCEFDINNLEEDLKKINGFIYKNNEIESKEDNENLEIFSENSIITLYYDDKEYCYIESKDNFNSVNVKQPIRRNSIGEKPSQEEETELKLKETELKLKETEDSIKKFFFDIFDIKDYKKIPLRILERADLFKLFFTYTDEFIIWKFLNNILNFVSKLSNLKHIKEQYNLLKFDPIIKGIEAPAPPAATAEPAAEPAAAATADAADAADARATGATAATADADGVLINKLISHIIKLKLLLNPNLLNLIIQALFEDINKSNQKIIIEKIIEIKKEAKYKDENEKRKILKVLEDYSNGKFKDFQNINQLLNTLTGLETDPATDADAGPGPDADAGADAGAVTGAVTDAVAGPDPGPVTAAATVADADAGADADADAVAATDITLTFILPNVETTQTKEKSTMRTGNIESIEKHFENLKLPHFSNLFDKIFKID